MDITTVLRRAIAERVGRNRFELWFGKRTQIEISGDTLVIGVPNPFFRDWVREHFRDDLVAVCEAVVGRTLDIAFRVATNASDENPPQGESDAPSAPKPSPEAATPVDGKVASRGRAKRPAARKKSITPSAGCASPTEPSSETSRLAPPTKPLGQRKVAAQPKRPAEAKTPPRQTAKKKVVAIKKPKASPRRAAPKVQGTTTVRPPACDGVGDLRGHGPRCEVSPPNGGLNSPRAGRPNVEASPPAPHSAGQKKKSAPTPDKPTVSSDATKPFRLVHGKDGKPRAVFTPGAEVSHKAGRAKLRRLDTFVEGRSNQLARMGAALATTQPGQVSPLYLHGPTSVGKTHLLEGILDAATRGPQPLSAVLITAEQFTTEFLDALRGGGLPNFRNKYRGVDMFLLDDIQFFLGKRSTVNEFRYTIDTLYRAGKQIILTGDRPLNQLRELGSDLITRLESGMPCRIDPPEIETRLGIVRQLAAEMRVEAGDDVCRFIASRLTNHARELAGALCRLKAAAMATRQPISLHLAETALADLIRENKRPVRLPEIEAAVCDAFGLDREALQSGGRAKNVSHPRMLAMWLARKYTRSGLSEIGQYFGNRSHSTVASAKKRVDSWLSSQEELSINDRSWTVEEAVRQIENTLQAG